MNKNGMGYYIETFGCQMNVRDSETIAGVLMTQGYDHACAKDEANFILYNTCCVRDHAEKRVFGNIGALREMKETNPKLIIAVCGCMMQQKDVAQRLFKRFPYVNLVFGTNMLSHLPSYLSEARIGNRVLAVDPTAVQIEDQLPAERTGIVNAFVNINYGCNNFCTYCIVPYVRGPERSRELESILTEVRSLVEKDHYSEITLLGQNVNSYGNDLDDTDFSTLLRQVSAVDGLKRIRFMTSHPKDLSNRLIHTIAELPNVCHHVHLPLQSGSDRILMAMNRRYTRERYLSIVKELRSTMNDIELTTDIIVGFPGETEEDFQQTLDLVDKVGFSSTFTFKYSPRTGTAAAAMLDQVSEDEKRERLKRLNARQKQLSLLSNKKYINHVGEVHVEGCDTRRDPLCYGKYMNFKMIYFPGNPDMIDSYVPVRVTDCKMNSLIGKMEAKNC
ncbi:MAG: tRNA (N6-isopentenyl adenosine(37)-C2)-methylthiotransferase MiaB [Clostridia bacterium]